MNFYLLYFYIPIVLYFVRPIKQNKVFIWYWALILILSYDNVTDFLYYYEEFFFYKNDSIGAFTERGREPLWVLLNKCMGFTDYGVVIIHVLIMSLTAWSIYKFSKRINLLNASLFLFFLFNYTWKFDNTVRQDVAILLGTYCIFNILRGGNWEKKRYIKIISLTLVAMGFHFSAFMLFPIYFFVKWISGKNLNILVVGIISLSLVIMSQNAMIQEIIGNLGFIFILIGGDYGMYYAEKFINLEMEANGTIGIFLSILSLAPLIYYKTYNKQAYNNNIILRTCVNLSWIFVVWKNSLSNDLFTRPAEYISLFSLWGFAFMLNDIMIKSIRGKLNLMAISLCMAYMVCSAWSSYNFITRYYGDNNYMTILSEECYHLRIYQRDRSSIGEGFKRYR